MKPWRKSKRQNNTRQPNLPGVFAAPAAQSRRLATPHDLALGVARGRLATAVALFALAFTIISGRVGFLTLFSEPGDSTSQHAQITDRTTGRVDITDRNGTVLATSLPTISLCADARKILDADEAERQLMKALPELDEKRLSNDLRNGKHCAMIKRHLTPKQYYEVNSLGIAGLEFQPDERRIYPAGNITAHVVGYTDIDNNGLAGVEKSMDSQLEEGTKPLALSIDLRLQSIMHSELSAAVDNFHALGGAGMIMDVRTGEVLAMVSLPDFDPQRPGTASDDARFNRDTLGVYEMGSTFKIFNTAMALDSGLIHVGDSFDTAHPIQVGHQFIKDYHPENRWLNVAEIFTHSSNIGAAHMAQRMGPARQRAFLGRLGLTEKAQIELPEVGAPLVPNARDWGEPTTMTVSFGHGIAVNAVQVVSAVAAIVNDGQPVHPTLLKKDSVPEANPNPVISARTSSLMRGLMRLVVTRGTAKAAEVNGYLIGGKTGTADKLSSNHKYDEHARLSSFIGAFPLNAPRYVVFALLDDPKGTTKTYGFATGGWTAAPVVSHVVSQMGPLMNMPPLDREMQAEAEKQVLRPLGPQIVDGMPIEEGSNYAAVESDSVQ
ncbi:MAG: penicillin-binding protein 2 [Alphaproteobacteria bacterium]|nr:penicillin-binding protein 2 [Alphaproteobacteria bacterium]MBV8547885.1 penicillin-binding protein 2 [Alphaproteobacteria bacterium]